MVRVFPSFFDTHLFLSQCVRFPIVTLPGTFLFELSETVWSSVIDNDGRNKRVAPSSHHYMEKITLQQMK